MLSRTLPRLCLFVKISLHQLVPSSRISTRIMRTLILLSKTLMTLERMLKVSKSGSLPAKSCMKTWLSRQFSEECNLRGLEWKSRGRKLKVLKMLKQLFKRLKELMRRQQREGEYQIVVGGIWSQLLVVLFNIATEPKQMNFKTKQIIKSQKGIG